MAAADPFVLRVRAWCATAEGGRTIDLSRWPLHGWRGGDAEHVRIDLPGRSLRLDLVEGTALAGGVRLEPAIDLDRPLAPQIASVRHLSAAISGSVRSEQDQRLFRLVEALRAADARAAGASLRDIGLALRHGEWPGDGEHIKSLARRRARLGAVLLDAGPGPVLSGLF